MGRYIMESVVKKIRETTRKRPVNVTGIDNVGEPLISSMMRIMDKKDLLEAVSKATDHYHDRNIIKDGGSGKVYKGKVSWKGQLMYIAVWRLDRQYRENYYDFRSEIAFLSAFEHDNISFMYNFFDKDEDEAEDDDDDDDDDDNNNDGDFYYDSNDYIDEQLIIYKHAFHGNLQEHLRKPDELTLSRRLQICLGVARGLNYIHNQSVIHCDIKSSKILLDEHWEPKIFGFELSTRFPQSWTHRLHLSRYPDTKRIMTPKYDVYLYGVLLFEVLCGKKPMFDDKDVLVEKLDDIIDPSLRKQIGSQSMKLLKDMADNCLDKQLVKRPSMNQIVKDLEEALERQRVQENLARSTDGGEGASGNSFLMQFLKIPLIKIKFATNNFEEARIVGYGGFGTVYRANLDVLDIQSVSSIKGKSKDELPRKSKTVAIKRLSKKGDAQAEQGFSTEIQLLTSCKHPNVVSLLGYCIEANEMILIYEYALKGSLSDYLRSELSLSWSQRIKICLDVARGINYLHTTMEGKPRIIHRDIKSENILLDQNLNAKIADFGLSRFHPMVGTKSTVLTKILAGTEVYIDPEYRMTGRYKSESDIYSFGVVLFEVLSGKMAYDSSYMMENDDGLAPIVRRRFNERTLAGLIDPKMYTKEDDELTFTLNIGPNQDSFDLFSNVGHECLAKTQVERPKMEVVIKALEDAFEAQVETILSRFRFSSLKFATQNFAKTCYMELDTYGNKVYKAQLDHFESNSSLLEIEGKNNGKKCISVAITRISHRKDKHGKEHFFSEIGMHTSYKHPNIAPLLGFCYEGDNMLLVYEHDSSESLDNYLRDSDNSSKHTWIQRLHLSLAIARGLNHLYTMMDRKQETIRIDIRSANILLVKSGEAKIAYCGFSKLLRANQEACTDTTHNNVYTKVYCCPEYQKTGERNKQSEIYSFGVVLFEIFCGRLAYDPVYTVENDNGLAPIACRCYSDGRIKKMIDPALKEETLQEILTSKREPLKESLNAYIRIAYLCLAENQARRPTMQSAIEELERALNIQENIIKGLQISFEDVQSATGNFSQKNCFGSGGFWKAYKGELRHSIANLDSVSASDSAGPIASDDNANTDFNIVAKRWHSKSSQADQQFRTEVSILIRRKHPYIIGLVGYCDEMDERIIIYEEASKGSLDMYLNDATLTWMKRLEICKDVAYALIFLHGDDGMLKKVVHGNIQSPAILLNEDWNAKLSNLEMSSLDSLELDREHVSNNTYGALGYLNPEYEQGYLTEKSDIYSFGVVMFEILCGRLAWSEGFEDHSESLGPLAKRHHKEGKLDEMVFEGIKEEIDPESMAIYADIASQCLHNIREKRPTADSVVSQIHKARVLQMDYERWLAKLSDCREIVQMAVPKIDAKGKDLYDILCKGIVIDEGKQWFSLGSNWEKNVMIASSQFSYENHHSLKLRSVQESRFHEIAEISDSSNLKISIKTTTQRLSVNIDYGVYLVFRFCAATKFSDKQKYVNLTYKMGSEALNAYFATWRKDKWMEIELYRFLNKREDTDFEFLLESFSQRYCGSRGIYVEGIEFRAIDNASLKILLHDNKEKQVKNYNSNMDPTQSLLASTAAYNISRIFPWPLSKLFSGGDYHMLSSMDLCDSSNAELYDLKPSTESRFREVIVLRPTQVFRIKCKIESKRLSPKKKFMCYLVFKLSEECCGLHCPVVVRDPCQGRSKKTRILYFRIPQRRNINDINQYPKEREDGWLEVNVWKIKSSDEPQNDCISINLKLDTYEGTMSGLVICGLEFRPM